MLDNNDVHRMLNNYAQDISIIGIDECTGTVICRLNNDELPPDDTEVVLCCQSFAGVMPVVVSWEVVDG